VNGLDFLWWVFAALPGLFLFDLLVFTFGLWWIRRWRSVRQQKAGQENALDH